MCNEISKSIGKRCYEGAGIAFRRWKFENGPVLFRPDGQHLESGILGAGNLSERLQGPAGRRAKGILGPVLRQIQGLPDDPYAHRRPVPTVLTIERGHGVRGEVLHSTNAKSAPNEHGAVGSTLRDRWKNRHYRQSHREYRDDDWSCVRHRRPPPQVPDSIYRNERFRSSNRAFFTSARPARPPAQ